MALAGGGVLLHHRLPTASATPDGAPDHWFLMADPHIAADPARMLRDVNMADHLAQAVAEMLAQDSPAPRALVNGDCAISAGKPGDYRELARLLRPLSEAGIELHLTLGNHDDRDVFRDSPAHAIAADGLPDLPEYHIQVVEGRHANWFLLDSLWEVDVVTGRLGEKQRAWLDKSLTKFNDKPAIVAGHHNLQLAKPADGARVSGLIDTDALLEILERHDHVAAYLFGHQHRSAVTRRDSGLWLVNMPAVAYVFQEQMPSAWVDAHVDSEKLHLELRCLDANHPWQGERRELALSRAAECVEGGLLQSL
jgi:3',5'-cyclic-AMP phosphodiesterase